MPSFLSQSAVQQTSVGADRPEPESPEELNGQDGVAAQATAIWYLGTLAHQLLTGIAPPKGIDGLSYSMRPFARLRVAEPGCPEELDNLLARMLSQDPAERPQSFDDVVAILHYASRAQDGAGDRR
jgi:serine/threonine protein kinase